MLAKIHLKTACGCERSYFENVDTPPYQIRVPVRATNIISWQGRLIPTEAYISRDFALVRREFRSKNRVGLWFEEVLYG